MTGTAAPLLGEPLVVELMNTVWADRVGVHDALSTPGEVAAWLAAVDPRLRETGLVLPSQARLVVDDRVTVDLRTLRDALRHLAAIVTGDPRPIAREEPAGAEAIETINTLAASAPSWRQLAWPARGQPTATLRSSASAPQTAVAILAGQAVEFFATDPSLRACLAPGCVLYFVRQHPRREWCGDACGNRARVARHHERRRLSAGPPEA